MTLTRFIAEGPGGGNPNVFLTGTEEDLTTYMREFHFLEDEDIDYYLNG